MTLLIALLAAAHAQTWPADDAWLPVPATGGVVEDPAGDAGAADDALDLVGDPASPALQWAADDAWLYIRLRVAGDPALSAADLRDGTWEVTVDVDGDDLLDGAWVVDGLADSLTVVEHAPGTASLDSPGVTVATLPLSRLRTMPSGGAFALDLAIAPDEAPLPSDRTMPFRLALLTRSSPSGPAVDAAPCAGTCPAALDALAAEVHADGDLDGLLTPVEWFLGLDPDDADSDDDGLLDGAEAQADSDGDGSIDALDCDSDDDGLLDGTEAGLFLAGLSPDTALVVGCWVGDADTTTWPTDPTLADSDGGGLDDGAEDWNHDGAVDPWETDPTDPADDDDTDDDGIADVLELLGPDGSIDDVDSDGDGIDDAVEGLVDRDGDGSPNFLDLDSDGDGIPDATEGAVDTDADGVLDAYDRDSDGDGIRDIDEGLVDTDGDGFPDYLDLDCDDDGIPDGTETNDDWDGDGLPNRIDPDADNDGIPDAIEGTRDTDEGGSPDYLDSDSDNDGISDSLEGSDDVDGDGTPNYRDLNSDGTSPNDQTEGIADLDCDGIPNFLDADDEDAFCDDPQPEPGLTGEGSPDFERPEAETGAGRFTGGSCDQTGGVASWAAILVALLAARRRACWLALLLPGAAGAQEVNAQRFAPVVDGGRFAKVVDGRTDRQHTLGLWMNHATDPLVFRAADGEETALLGLVDTTAAVGSVGFGWFRLGAELPVHVASEGLGFEPGLQRGDARLSGEVRLFRSEDLHAGVWSDLSLPTATPDAWVGAGVPTLRFGAAISLERGPLLVAFDLGGKTGTGASMGGLVVRDGPIGALGASWALSEELALTLELDREDWLGNPNEPGAHPMEWLAGFRALSGEAALTVGLGTGIGSGIGAPDLRAAAGLMVRLGGEHAEDPEG